MSDSPPHIVLFNDERYHRCNLRAGERLFRYDHHAAGRLVGTLSGVVVGRALHCGHSAPFGGIDWSRQREPVGSVAALLEAAIQQARADGIDEIHIRARPAYFGTNETSVEFALFGLGATVEGCEISLGLDVRQYSSPDAYIAALKCFGRNRLRHGLDGELSVAPAQTVAEWAACYELLAETKRRRGAQLKFSLDYLLNLRAIFGARIAMHRLLHRGELAAAALVYRIAPAWDYLVAWGDDIAHRGDKVMNVMAYHLACRAIAERLAVLDLGISSVNGVPDDGLIQFKRSVGAATGLRVDFCLALT